MTGNESNVRMSTEISVKLIRDVRLIFGPRQGTPHPTSHFEIRLICIWHFAQIENILPMNRITVTKSEKLSWKMFTKIHENLANLS